MLIFIPVIGNNFWVFLILFIKFLKETRQNRISSWKNFVSNKDSVSTKSGAGSSSIIIPKKGFKPPKHKPETR